MWAHPTSIKLFRLFPKVLILDATYKTNKYNLPLLQIVGVTSTELTFQVAFAYLGHELATHFSWALKQLKELCDLHGILPEIFLTDRELGSMSAISEVFPSATNLLCHWHVSKNVKAKIKELVSDKERQKDLNSLWLSLVDSHDLSDYSHNLSILEESCSDIPLLKKYIHESWLTPYKERFIKAWTNELPHLGNQTTNRAESAHAMLKKHLRSSRGDLSKCFVYIDELLRVHFDKVIASFQRSINRIQVSSNIPLFKLLRGVVSLNALSYMVEELQRSQAGVGYDKILCGCLKRKVFLLPCACEIGLKFMSGMPIKVSDVDLHWRHLKLDVFDEKSNQESTSDCDISLEVAGVFARFNKSSLDEKFLLKKALKDLAWPSTTSMVPPLNKAKTKGAPKKKKPKFFDAKREPSRWEHVDEKVRLTEETGTSIIKSSQRSSYTKKSSQPASKMSQGAFRKLSQTLDTRDNLQFIMPHMHPYVEEIIDVLGDGNCGFRACGVGLNLGENGWPVIRQDLIKETKEREDFYSSIFGKNRVLEIRKAFTPEGAGAQKEEKWLDMPEMGSFIATKYNVAVVQLSLSMNFLFLPLRGSYALSKHKMIAILNRKNSHWLHVSLSPTCPLPPVYPLWWQNRSPESASWLDPFFGRLSLWQNICPQASEPPRHPPTSYDAPICVDLADDTDGL